MTTLKKELRKELKVMGLKTSQINKILKIIYNHNKMLKDRFLIRLYYEGSEIFEEIDKLSGLK